MLGEDTMKRTATATSERSVTSLAVATKGLILAGSHRSVALPHQAHPAHARVLETSCAGSSRVVVAATPTVGPFQLSLDVEAQLRSRICQT